MSLQREQGIISRHAVAVVLDPHERPPAMAKFDLNARGPGIEGVLDEFLHDRRRPLDTSPAAIWLATRSERMRTVAIVAQGYLRSEREGTTSRTIPLASIRLTR